jgi:hypothetical protein
MAKREGWRRGLGAYSKDEPDLTRRRDLDDSGNYVPARRPQVVDDRADGGYAAPLPKK